MTFAVLGWQLFIFFTIVISGKKAGWTSIFWIIWTFVQVYGLPLSVIQFITIYVAYKFTAKVRQKDNQ